MLRPTAIELGSARHWQILLHVLVLSSELFCLSDRLKTCVLGVTKLLAQPFFPKPGGPLLGRVLNMEQELVGHVSDGVASGSTRTSTRDHVHAVAGGGTTPDMAQRQLHDVAEFPFALVKDMPEW